MDRCRLRDSDRAWRILGLGLIVVLALVVASPPTPPGVMTASAAPPAASPSRGGTITVGLVNQPDTLDPHRSAAGPDRHILFQIYDSLLRFDQTLRVTPGQVKAWKALGDLTFQFVLNDGLKFHDGTDLDAKAVAWNFERMMNKSLKLVPYSDLVDVDKVVAIDRLTFQITLKKPLAPLLALLADRAGMMISPAAWEKSGADNYGRNPVGAGAFKFVEWRQGDSVTLQRFDGYFVKGEPYVDKVVFKFIADAAVRAVSLQSGQIDVLGDIPAAAVKALKSDPGLKFYEGAGLQWSYFMFNTSKAPFDNIKVRQAVAFAVQRPALVASVHEDQASVAQGPFSPTSWAYDKKLDGYYRYDPAKARALLTEAGYGPGHPLKFQMLTTTDPMWLRQSEMVQADLRAIGVEATIQPYELATAIENMRNGTFQGMSLAFSGRADPDGNAFMRWHSTGTLNYMRYKSERMDQLLEASRRTYDPQKRAEIFKQVNRVMLEDLPLTFFTIGKAQNATSKRVQNFTLIPDGMVRLSEIWLAK
jgi:peptide/nickel transport system substrate-binding protein